MLQTSIPILNFYQRNLLNKTNGIMTFIKSFFFLNFIADIMNRYLNSTSDLNLSCARDFGGDRIVW